VVVLQQRQRRENKLAHETYLKVLSRLLSSRPGTRGYT
jgi:hypothetical protein